MSLRTTSSQTIGPYLHIGMTWLVIDDLTAQGASGEKFTIEGTVVDGDAAPINDAMLEIWQANAQGKYAHPEDAQEKPLDPNFRGFGRVYTDNSGRFRFTTIKPGRVPGAEGGMQAPHLNISIFTRGLLKHLVTRLYFPDEAANADDEVLKRVPAQRRATLIARRGASGGNALEWNVVVQGAGETVFFEI